VAARFPALLTVLYSIFFQAWQLSAMEEYGKESYGIFFGRVFGVISSTMFLSSSLFFLIVKPFMDVFVGKAFAESWKYVPFLFLGAVYNTFASFYGVNYTASKKTIGAFSTSVVAAGIKLMSILTLIRFLGIQAASVSSFLAYLSMWLARIFHTRKLTQVEIDKKHLTISSILLICQALVLLFVETTILMYMLQGIIVAILLVLQRKYLKQVFQFARSLFRERNVLI
jgi:O-antigen/teichoic acid export membrane protein